MHYINHLTLFFEDGDACKCYYKTFLFSINSADLGYVSILYRASVHLCTMASRSCAEPGGRPKIVQPVMQQFESRTVRKAPLQSTHTERNSAALPGYISYRLKSEVSITLHCQLCSTRSTAVRTKNCSKNTFAIKTATMKNTDNFRYERKPSCATAKLIFFAVSKDEWDTKDDTGKSMKNALYILRYVKRHLSARSDIKQ